MNIGVTGGAGFIGSHLIDQLVKDGHNVTVFDKCKANRKDVRHVNIDILSKQDCIKNFKDIEVMYHLAAVSDVNIAIKNRNLTVALNISGTINVLEACEENCVDRIIFASTEWVYSGLENNNDIAHEGQNLRLDKMGHIYTSTKYIAESIVESYCRSSNLNYSILRFGIPYGPRGRNGTVFFNFINNILEGKSIKVFGTGEQYRNFIYIEDLAEGCIAALSSEAKNEIINLSGAKQITINQIAIMLKEISKHPVKIEYIDIRQEDFKGVEVSNNRAKILLNWEPKTSLEEGLTKYYDYMVEKSSVPV